jgi:hypothetical protein
MTGNDLAGAFVRELCVFVAIVSVIAGSVGAGLLWFFSHFSVSFHWS